MILHSIVNYKSQQGAALLIFMLVLILGATSTLLTKLQTNATNRENVEQTYQALTRAKQALISFALTVPERSRASPRSGPGYLPCPDTDNDGDAEGGCRVNAIGRIPYETLEEDVLYDDSGAVLWYALSNNYRNIGGLLNSQTGGQLTLDGQADIVAVIMAPGEPVDKQQRNVKPNSVANYLEKDNANDNARFISFLQNNNPLVFNDRVIAITRQELMMAVEKRVLNELARSMGNYRNSFGAGNQAYPWLSVFANPSPDAPTPPNSFNGVPGHSAGYLSVHIVNPAINYINNATTTFTANWAGLTGGKIVFAGHLVDDLCLRNSACIDSVNYVAGAPNIANPISAMNVNCTWQNRNNFSCSTINDIPLGSQTWPRGGSGKVTRSYSINYTDDGSNIIVKPPTKALTRTRNLNVDDNFTGQLTIQMIDSSGEAEIGRATLTLNAVDSGGVMNITGVDFHLDANGINLNPGNGPGLDNDYLDENEFVPDIPPWFVNNNWHHLTYIAYPTVEALPGAPDSRAGVCTIGRTCLTLTATNGATVAVVNNNIRALAVIAGQDLTLLATPRPNGTLTDYFDGRDSNGTPLIYDKQLVSNTFNDQVRVILTKLVP